MTHLVIYKYVCNWAAQKQSRSQSQTDLSIYMYTHLHQHTWSIVFNTQLLRVQNVQKHGFLNSRLLNLREIRKN